jgi:hypothetical protein
MRSDVSEGKYYLIRANGAARELSAYLGLFHAAGMFFLRCGSLDCLCK